MNTQVGKSAGIALLLAAGLIAVLFAFGFFAPAGVGAIKGTPAPTAELSNTRVSTTGANAVTQTATLTVTFQLNDDVNAGNREVAVTLPSGIATNDNVAGASALSISVKQNGQEVGSASVSGDDEITIAQPTVTGRGIVAEDTETTVTVAGLALAETPASGMVTITQGEGVGAGSETTNTIGIFNHAAVPTSASAAISGDDPNTLVIKFTVQTDQSVVRITPPDKYLIAGGATGNITAAAGAATLTPDLTTTLGSVEIDPPDTANTEVVVTITKLSNLAAGDEITLFQAVSSYSATIEVDGATVSPTGGPAGADDTAAVLGGTAAAPNNKADAATKVELTGLSADNTNGIRGGNDIVITLPKFHIPSSIAESQIIVEELPDTGDTDAEYYGPPESASVSGDKITITVPRRIEVGTGTELNVITGAYTILIKKSAGIKNPNSASNQTIMVQDLDTTNHEKMVSIVSHISPDPAWVERGDVVTVTAKGINAAGDATVHLLNMANFDDVGVLNVYDLANDIEDIAELESTVRDMLMADPATLDGEDLAVLPALDRSLRDAGTAVLDFDTSSSMFNAQAQNATGDGVTEVAKGTNLLVVVDAGGNVIGHSRLGLQPKVTLDLAEVRRTGRMGVTVSDWYYGDLTDIRVNGIQVRLPDPDNADDSVEWSDQPPPAVQPLTVVVPRRARLGTMEVVVSGTTTAKQGTESSLDKHVQTVDVGVFDLTITPSTAVTDQVIRIEGSGFGPTQCITSITVGDERIRRATTGDQVSIGALGDCVRTDSDGALSNSFKVPHNLKPGDYPVVITDALNRVGQGLITVPKPTITMDPEASQRGSTVTVIGESFPAEDVVGITYGADPVTVATTDTVGKWRATFKVPVDATIGREYEVVAQSEKKGTGQTRVVTGEQTVSLNAMATHTVPEEILTVSPEAVSSGQRLNITASNLPLYTPVSLTIGGLAVAGKVVGQDDASDGFGRYEKELLVPQLTVGTHNVELEVHTVGTDVVVVTFVEVLDIVTRPTNEVFVDLIEADILSVVWRYDNTTGTWASYDPAAPAEVNDLELVSNGHIVWVQTTADYNFQGNSYLAGWNLYALE